jgi:coproporphyrinogen III oxidase
MNEIREIELVRDWLTELQDRICAAIEQADGAARFAEDAWTRAEGGGGRTRVLREGAVFEQAGIGFSDVSGTTLPPAATAARPELAGAAWRAVGVSLVLHPRNPYVPTTHMNVRHFRAQRDGKPWPGGSAAAST